MFELIKYFNNNIMSIEYFQIKRKLVFITDRYYEFFLQQSYLDKFNMVNCEYIKINEFINYA